MEKRIHVRRRIRLNIFEAVAGTVYKGQIGYDWRPDVFVFVGITGAFMGYVYFMVISERGVERCMYGDEVMDDLDWTSL